MRGPRGGYELARERRRISMGEIVRAALNSADDGEGGGDSRLVGEVIGPVAAEAGQQFLASLEGISVDDLCKRAEAAAVFGPIEANSDFTI